MNMNVYETGRLYFIFFSRTIASIIPMSMLYIPLNIVITSFLLNRFQIKKLSTTINELAKSIFCATLLSIALPWMFGLIIARALQGHSFFSIPVIIDEAQCILIIIFSSIYSRIQLNKIPSFIWGILLFIFATPEVGGALYMLSQYAFFSPELGYYNFIIYFIIMLIMSSIQIISLRNIAHKYRDRSITHNTFFLIFFISNFISMLIIKNILLFLRDYFGIMW